MYWKKVKLRAFFILLIFVSLSLTAFLIFKSFEDNVVYFKSPTEIKNSPELETKKIRVGGMVKDQSIVINSDKITLTYNKSISEIIQIINLCDFVIGNESGPICLGASYKKEVHSIYLPIHTKPESQIISNKTIYYNTEKERKTAQKVLDEISFTATDRGGEKIIIDKDYVTKNLGELAKDTDLSKFIL